jgi:capsular polysaccharide transport system permease protein
MTLSRALADQGRILVALMLRDVRTRFFGSALGMVIAIGWPLSNIFIVLAIYTAMGRAAPYGESAALWFSTGLVPFMAFQYMARFITLGLVMNRPMLGFPVVKVMDVLLARGLVEVLNAGVVTIAAMLVLAAMGVSFMPDDPVQAVYAMCASILLGLGFGIFNGAIAGMLPFWAIGYGLFGIVMWAASGVAISPEGLPETARYWLSFNPALQGVVWMRSAYYEGYGEEILDKSYMLSFALGSLFLGLLIERLARGRILQGS